MRFGPLDNAKATAWIVIVVVALVACLIIWLVQ
jgi:hypothetical protein